MEMRSQVLKVPDAVACSGPAAQRRRLNAEGDGLGQQVPQQRQGSRKQPPAKEKKKDREKARRQRENDW